MSIESAAGGPHHHHLIRACVALLLATASAPSVAAADQPAAQQRDQEAIVVTAPVFRDVLPERSLQEDAIESYGVSTIDELLGYIESETGDDSDQPLVLVNGQRINDVSEIGTFPVEALRSVEVLPRGSAVRAGGRPGQRVISITLKRRSRTATLTAAHKLATEGEWTGERGEALLTNVNGNTRANLALRGGREDALLESQRGIIQPSASVPYALSGNVIGYPNTSGEIDPSLSALAGQVVTVAAVPGVAAPTLTDFLSHANVPAFTDLGEFRTLRPRSGHYDLNGNFAAPIAPWLNSSTTVRLSRNDSDSLRGLADAIFVLPASNAASPFSRAVGLAFYGNRPLHSHSRLVSGEVNETLNATFGEWTANVNARHTDSNETTYIDRQSASAPILLNDATNPFATDLTSTIGLATDQTGAHRINSLAQVVLNGPAANLPAGPIQATVEARLGWNKLRSSSSFSTFGNGTFRREEHSLRGAVDVPIASRADNVLPQLGELSADGEYQLFHYSDAGSLSHYAMGLTWEPAQMLRLRGEIQGTDLPPDIELLGDPIMETPGVRVFDPLTGQTVDVTQITGGNRNLKPERDTIRRVSGLLRLLPKLNLQLNAEYTDTDRRNFISSLPEASAAVELAFPDRFVRTDGVLTAVDLRPVNFQSERQKMLRWGLSMNKRVGGSDPTAPNATASGRLRTPPTYFQLTVNDTIVFSDEIVIRPGLDSVDLLRGGAIGIGGGRARHQLDGTAALTSGGIGVRMGVTWRGRNELLSRFNGVTDTLQFSPLLAINLRAFADVKRFAPHASWAKGLRVSVDAVNLTDKRQRVRDSFGNTPLQYQPAYRDPLGRTIEVELRKVF